MKKTRLFLLLICVGGLITLWQCLPEFTPPEIEARVVYRLYLPITYKVALHGVGLSGPCSAVGLLGVDWYYNWSVGPCVAGDPRYVPMIWGRDQMVLLPQAVIVARQGSGWLLGFNEPDLEVQANIAPEEAAELWRQIEAQAGGIKLVSPVTSQHDPGWLWRMANAYKGKYGRKPRFDAIAAHYYTWLPPSPQKTKDYLLQVRREALAHGYDTPIWLTEFGAMCWKPEPAGGNQALMRELMPWMRSQSWIGRYAWFASRLPQPPWVLNAAHCSLTDTQTFQLTELGELYKELK